MLTNDKGIVELKHFILREICRLAWEDRLTEENKEKIVYEVSPGPKPQYRCCVYKEREIVRRQELRSTGGNCQGDDRQESCSSAGNCQADEQTVITQLSRP